MGTMLQRVLIDEALEMPFKFTGHVGWATGPGAIQHALGTLRGKALPPGAEGRSGQVEQRGDSLDLVARDDLTDGLRAAKDPDLCGLLEHGVSCRQRISAQVACERPQRLAPWRRMTYSDTLLSGAKWLRLKFLRFCLHSQTNCPVCACSW